MLALPAMVVVIVHRVTYGSFKLTASRWSFGIILDIKCHSDDTFGNERVKRGKPHKQETQIMVGEPDGRNWTEVGIE